MSRILRPDAPLDMDTQARLLEQLLSVMSEAGVDVLEVIKDDEDISEHDQRKPESAQSQI